LLQLLSPHLLLVESPHFDLQKFRNLRRVQIAQVFELIHGQMTEYSLIENEFPILENNGRLFETG